MPNYSPKPKDASFFGTVDPEQLLSQFGSPLFVVSEKYIRNKYQDLKKSLEANYGNGSIAYSFKTNYLSRICRTLLNEGALAEVTSGAEYQLAKKNGYEGSHIIFNGPLKTEKELETALDDGAQIHIDSIEEYEKIERITNKRQTFTSIGIRLYSTEIIHQLRKKYPNARGLFERFGFNIENGEAAMLCQRIKKSGTLISVAGYHMHITSNITDPLLYENASRKMGEFATDMQNRFGIVCSYIDMGGGFPHLDRVQNTSEETPPLDVFVRSINKGIEQAHLKQKPQLLLEPGRYIVSGSTVLLTRVVSVKQFNTASQLVTIDSSSSILSTWQWGQHQIEASTGNHSDNVDTIIAGSSCMAKDVYGRYQLPKLHEKDVLVIKNCGAYSISQTSQFIFPRPAVVWIDMDGKASLARQAERWEDMVRLDL